MLKTIIAALAATALIAAPGAAQNANFIGPRIELNAGVLNLDTDNADYGAAAGYDFALSPRVTLGGEVATANTFDDNARELGANARLGYAVHPNVLLYGLVGYNRLQLDNAKDLEGLNAGGGLEYTLGHKIFTGAEYRYTNFNRGYDRHGLVARIGFRF